MFREVACTVCEKVFQQNSRFGNSRAAIAANDDILCYGCALERITHGHAPEEGDFNSALIISGEMTDEEARDLQEDLESVEQGRSIREDFKDEDICEICGGDRHWCSCADKYGD